MADNPKDSLSPEHDPFPWDGDEATDQQLVPRRARYQRETIDNYDGRPRVGDGEGGDRLLDALKAEHGESGRADIWQGPPPKAP